MGRQGLPCTAPPNSQHSAWAEGCHVSLGFDRDPGFRVPQPGSSAQSVSTETDPITEPFDGRLHLCLVCISELLHKGLQELVGCFAHDSPLDGLNGAPLRLASTAATGAWSPGCPWAIVASCHPANWPAFWPWACTQMWPCAPSHCVQLRHWANDPRMVAGHCLPVSAGRSCGTTRNVFQPSPLAAR